jgi:hypothetical protein
MNAAATGPPTAAHQPNSGASSPNAAAPRTRIVSVATSWTVFWAARERRKPPAAVRYSATSSVSVQAMPYDRRPARDGAPGFLPAARRPSR